MAKYRGNKIVIPGDPPQKPSLIAIGIMLFIAPPITTLVGLYLGYKRLKNEFTRKQLQSFRRYAYAIGDRTDVSIRELAASLGKPTANVVSELQAMIDQGMIQGSAYIDRSHMILHLDSDYVETEFATPVVNVYVNAEDRAKTVAQAREKAAQARAQEPAPRREEPTQQQSAKRQQAEKRTSPTDSENFEAKLREIRQLNDDIADEAVSRRIDRIGELTASIFRVVREKPERAEEVRKFMNYYLPTTLKLLKSYSRMEKQSYQGEHIVASRKKIEESLDTLIHGFEQQQDRLFRTEALDVETDISVLETMMASDGLLENEGGLRATSGSGKN